MGGICSRSWKATVDGVAVDNALSGSSRHANGHASSEPGMAYQSSGLPGSLDSNSNVLPDDEDYLDKHQRESFSFTGLENISYGSGADDVNDGIPRLSRALSHKSKSKQAAVKVSEVSSLLGRAGTAGLGKAVEVLDTLGSSMTNLNLSSSFTSGVTTKGNKISSLAFVDANTTVKGANLMDANTTVKGANLMECLSKENVRHLKEVVLPSEGVRNLICRDMDELLRIVAADKRSEVCKALGISETQCDPINGHD